MILWLHVLRRLGNNAFGPLDCLSRDYSHIISHLAMHAYTCIKNPSLLSSPAGETAGDTCVLPPPSLSPFMDDAGCTAFDKAGLAFALAITNQYDTYASWICCCCYCCIPLMLLFFCLCLPVQRSVSCSLSLSPFVSFCDLSLLSAS